MKTFTRFVGLFVLFATLALCFAAYPEWMERTLNEKYGSWLVHWSISSRTPVLVAALAHLTVFFSTLLATICGLAAMVAPWIALPEYDTSIPLQIDPDARIRVL